jgi:predicted DNA-binding transcriptional regulator YafY
MDRLERLLDLLAALLDAERPLTREALRNRIPGYPADDASARRAFERDKDSLRAMGIPIETLPLVAGDADAQVGYRVRREAYELPDPGLTADEVAALHLAVSTVDLAGATDSDAAAALWKLGGSSERIEPPPATAGLPGSEHLPVLFAAAVERRRVRFPYGGVERLFEPYRLSCAKGRWYVSGRDLTREADRVFRVDRLEGAPVPTGGRGAFERPAGAGTGAPPAPWLLGDRVVAEALVLVDADQAAWAVAQAGDGGTVDERRSDGSLVLRLPVANVAALRSFVLGFLDHAEVLGPPELRADLVGWLERVP